LSKSPNPATVKNSTMVVGHRQEGKQRCERYGKRVDLHLTVSLGDVDGLKFETEDLVLSPTAGHQTAVVR